MALRLKHNKLVYVTMIGHICSDINQGALLALIPFIIAHNGYSYAQAASLVFISNIVSAVVQPLFGWLGDKVNKPAFMVVGVVLSCTGMSLVGYMPNFTLLACVVAVSGIGTAMFHPEGGRIANLAGGANKSSAVSIFSVGGSLGFTFGPLIAAFAVTMWGMQGTALLLIPMVTFLIISFLVRKDIAQLSSRKKSSFENAQVKENIRGFSFTALVSTCRSIIYYGLNTFIPLYFIANHGQDESFGALMLSLFSIGNIIATLAGGSLANTVGYRRLIRICYITLVPLLLIFALNTNFYISIALLLLIPCSLTFGFSTTTALGQSFLSNHVGTATGVMIGVAVSVGGIVAPMLGSLGDNYGLNVVFLALTGVAFLASCFAMAIPKEPDRT